MADSESLSGCFSQGYTPGEQIDQSTLSPADEFGDCPDGPDSNQVKIPAWPDKPDSLTRETVKRFVRQYEKAFRARGAFPTERDNIKAVHVIGAPSKNDVTRTDGGWLVHFFVSEPSFVFRSPTPTENSQDSLAMFSVSYFVNDDAVFRATQQKVDPREEGTELQCNKIDSKT